MRNFYKKELVYRLTQSTQSIQDSRKERREQKEILKFYVVITNEWDLSFRPDRESRYLLPSMTEFTHLPPPAGGVLLLIEEIFSIIHCFIHDLQKFNVIDMKNVK